jgi:7-cyano-7-deazaguanine synthase
MKTAVLLSGGMDSLALTWWKRPEVAITINYGQLAADAELNASSAICKELGIRHEVFRLSELCVLGSGDLAGTAQDPLAPASDWWPYRNQLLITIAAMRSIRLGINQLLIGTVQSDGSHLDGTPTFVEAMSHVLMMQEGALSVSAPAIHMSTAELILTSEIPANQLAWAHSCHKSNIPCGNCRGCNKYFSVYGELGYDLDQPRKPSP